MRGAVASGHPLTARAAGDMFSLGGNAFDAAVAAGFASVAAEPTLTSLGGGGFLLAHIAEQKEDILFDFFVNTPGLGSRTDGKPAMTPVDIHFPECTQVFHTGFPSAAVPGMLKGLLHVHRSLCTLPLETVLAPALSCLREGVEVTALQEYFLNLLEPIFGSTGYGREIYTPGGECMKQGGRLFNPLLKEFFGGIAEGRSDIYSAEAARNFTEEMKKHGCLITPGDLEAYRVIERNPLRIAYRDREILTNPPPSSGGMMLALGLRLIENIRLSSVCRESGEFFITLVELMKRMQDFRPVKNRSGTARPLDSTELSPLIESFLRNVSERTFIATQGTTHISTVDEKGNAASMTTSNGSGSGRFIPGTGIMLNNMMGEDDLHPDGFFSSPPGERVSSMMVPAIILRNGRADVVMGSGGSKRIKTAVLQVLLNIIDFKRPLEEAVEAPRIHLEDGTVHTEPGLPADVAGKLAAHYDINRWNTKNMYFGGVHCVNGEMHGWGDSRRGGVFLTAGQP